MELLKLETMIVNHDNVGAILRAARLASGRTQAEIALACGTTASMVSQRERSQHRPPVAVFAATLAVCGYTVQVVPNA